MTNSLPLRQYPFTDFGGKANTQTGPSSTIARYRRRSHRGRDQTDRQPGAGEGKVPGRACEVAVTGAGTRARSYHASPGEIKSVGSCAQES